MQYLSRVSLLLALVLAAILLALPAPAARAADIRSGPQPSLPAGQTVDDDLYIVGGTVAIDGNVTRDVTVAGGTVTVAGQVGGNLNVAGGEVTVNGPVRGAIRVAGGTVSLNGPIGWDLLTTGGTVRVSSNAAVGHDLILAGGTVTVDGNVTRDVRGNAGALTINGAVGRDVTVDVGALTVGPRARIVGNLTYTSGQDASIASDATIGGTTTHTRPPQRSTAQAIVAWLGDFILRIVWALLIGTALILLLPVRTTEVATTLRERPLISLAWGIPVLIVVPVVVIVLLVTVVGIPVAVFLLALYLAALYLSQVIVGLTLGRLLLPRPWRDTERLHLWVAMLVGVLILAVIRLLPLPFGWTFWWSLVIALLALGAIWTTLTGWGRHPARPPSQPVPSPPAPTEEPTLPA